MRAGHVMFAAGFAAVVSFGASPAFAQGGAVGGTIGKTNKAVQGDVPGAKRVPPAERRRVHAKQPQEPGHAKTGNCGNLAGTWTAVGWWNGVYGRGDVTLNADGTARHVSGIKGHWTCANKKFAINWTGWASGSGTLAGNSVVDSNGKAMMVRGR